MIDIQTFLPYPRFSESARVIDNRRLGKQRVETLQILNSLIDGGGWKNHPAVKMWRGHELALALYGLMVCREWRSRGFNDTCTDKIWVKVGKPTALELNGAPKPYWVGDPDFHLSHQSNLIRKLPDHYGPLFPGVPDNLPYVWPKPEGVNG